MATCPTRLSRKLHTWRGVLIQGCLAKKNVTPKKLFFYEVKVSSIHTWDLHSCWELRESLHSPPHTLDSDNAPRTKPPVLVQLVFKYFVKVIGQHKKTTWLHAYNARWPMPFDNKAFHISSFWTSTCKVGGVNNKTEKQFSQLSLSPVRHEKTRQSSSIKSLCGNERSNYNFSSLNKDIWAKLLAKFIRVLCQMK